jgi:hypothetical protein
MTTTIETTIKNIERMKNSKNGNANYTFRLATGLELKTPRDAMWVCAVSPDNLVGKVKRIQYNIKTGVIEDIEGL